MNGLETLYLTKKQKNPMTQLWDIRVYYKEYKVHMDTYISKHF